MYDYRRMTPKQRQEVVQRRLLQGVPLHRPPHLKEVEGWYLISAATYEHHHHFTRANELTALRKRLVEAIVGASLPLAAWVVLPNHYHALLHTDGLKRVGEAVGPVHGRSSHYANRRDGTKGRQVWHRYTDRAMRSERHFWTTVHYIINNPVKHGYVNEPTDWPWSCVHELIDEHGQEWVNGLRLCFPLRDCGKGWDE